MFNAGCSFGLSPDEKAYMNLISYYGKAGMVLLSAVDVFSQKPTEVNVLVLELQLLSRIHS